MRLTPREAERLRAVSYARQLEAGMHNPGSAGLTADRLGDAGKWVVPTSVASNGSAGDALLIQPDGADKTQTTVLGN